jgi:hypothetical protein
LFPIDLVEECGEYQENADRTEPRKRMLVNQTRQKNGERLSQGHDRGEDQRSKRRNGVKDEQLAGSRTDGEQDTVDQQSRTIVQKSQTQRQIALFERRSASQQNRVEVDGRHHLARADRVLVEQLSLPVGRERVERDVQRQNDETVQQVIRVLLLLCVDVQLRVVRLDAVIAQQEEGHSERDCDRKKVLDRLVRLFVDHLRHEHDGQQLAGFRKHLLEVRQEAEGGD